MSKSKLKMPPEVNKLIITKLRAFPELVSDAAIQAIQLSEQYSDAAVYEMLHAKIRDSIKKAGDQS